MKIRSMGLPMLTAVLLLALAAGCSFAAEEEGSGRGDPGGADPAKGIDVQQGQDNGKTAAAAGKMKAISITKDSIHKGSLVLVNKKYAVPAEYAKSDVVRLYDHKELIDGYGLLDNQIRLSRSVAERFIGMVKDAQQDGVSHFLISSGYRSNEEQKELYKMYGSKSALPPGHSEHNLGLSLDIGSSQGEMSKAEEGKWLKKNAWKYGFILRYPEDKTSITGIKYEPWHFRYVGLPHSAVIHSEGLVLEEYLDELRDKKAIEMEVEGKSYEISYHPVGGKIKLEVPTGKPYELSGDNSGGVILAVQTS